jgi:hypothetical protein
MRTALITIACLAIACGGDDETAGAANAAGGGGGGGGAGDCLPSETLESGVCVPAGVPDGECGDGFMSDGAAGCVAVLPTDACPAGTMALVGEEMCRPVAPCGQGTWGDIPVEPGTVYVDASYAGGNGDGSEGAPYTTLQAAVTAAPSDAQLALAEGTYSLNADLTKPLRIWGRCPALVEVVGSARPALAIVAASGELHTLALTGASGVIMSRPSPMIIDRLWVHDTSERGIGAESTLAPTQLTVTGTLIENASTYGVYNSGATVDVVDTVIRDTQYDVATSQGRGLYYITNTVNADRAYGTVRHVLIERSNELGVAVGGADLTIEDTLIRDTLPSSSGTLGRALVVQSEPDTQATSNVSLRRSVIERSLDVGVFVLGGSFEMEHSVVRDTAAELSDGSNGWNLDLQDDPRTLVPATVSIKTSTIERGVDIGMFVVGTNLTMERSVVRDTLLGPQMFGRGMHVQLDIDTGVPTTAVIERSALLRNSEAGLIVNSATVTLTECLLAESVPSEGSVVLGDGLAVLSIPGPPSVVVVSGSLIRDNARAGLSIYGSAITLRNNQVRCNGFDIDAEEFDGVAATLDNAGGNTCGCELEEPCKAVSAGLQPPAQP